MMGAVEMKAPPCRVCGDAKWVAVWREDKPEQTVCMECCEITEHANGETGHEFDRGSWLSVPACIHCGMER